jgi:HTH-type transcriptional regulator/antitoxin HigA
VPRTHLDGAALRLADDRPVVGLTLRYDRLDNFWFCLLHELAHVGRHQDDGGHTVFVDDHSLRPTTPGPADTQEAEADAWAEEALIPAAAWRTSEVRQAPTTMSAIDLAQSLGISPAIVAGRVRHERANYRLLSHLVGSGHVRRQFETA